MTAQRFILRRGAGATEDGLAEFLRAQPGLQMLDSSPRMLLVSGERALIDAALAHHPGWLLTPETQTPLPDTRPRVRKPI